MMSVTVQSFGTTQSGEKVNRIILKNTSGTAVSILDRGATLQSFTCFGKDILLGYDNVSDYETANGSYIGATIGRFCNRIADGRFTLNGVDYQLACNEADKHGHLHGGNVGFDKKIWHFEILSMLGEPAVRFSLVSPDGEEGYPGRLEVSVTYRLLADNTLEIGYCAASDRDTIVNFTNHSYFNLNGYDGEDVLSTQLKVNADAITRINDVLIPTGELMPVEGTPLDFRSPKTIGKAISGDHEQLRLAGGVDHNFVLSMEKGTMREAAVAYSPITGIELTCSTDQPGLQIYTANFLHEDHGKDGYRWRQYGGFCLESQCFPDSINHPEFPSVVLHAGEEYRTVTRFHVAKRSNE